MMTGRDELGNVRELLSCCLLSKYVGMFLQKLRYLQGIHGQSLHLISCALFAQQVNEGCFVVVFTDGLANNSRVAPQIQQIINDLEGQTDARAITF